MPHLFHRLQNLVCFRHAAEIAGRCWVVAPQAHRPPISAPYPIARGNKQGLVLMRGTHWPDRMTVAAIVVVHIAIARIEVEAPRVVRAVRAE